MSCTADISCVDDNPHCHTGDGDGCNEDYARSHPEHRHAMDWDEARAVVERDEAWDCDGDLVTGVGEPAFDADNDYRVLLNYVHPVNGKIGPTPMVLSYTVNAERPSIILVPDFEPVTENEMAEVIASLTGGA